MNVTNQTDLMEDVDKMLFAQTRTAVIRANARPVILEIPHKFVTISTNAFKQKLVD